MIDCEKGDVSRSEIQYWRHWFLKKHGVSDNLAMSCFLYHPSGDFVQKTPEENLIESLTVALDKN